MTPQLYVEPCTGVLADSVPRTLSGADSLSGNYPLADYVPPGTILPAHYPLGDYVPPYSN